jgi:hypothetical protein
MDGTRLDQLARLAAGLAVAVFGSLAMRLAGRADNMKVGQQCNKNGDCCTRAECKGGDCRCKSGRAECGGRC